MWVRQLLHLAPITDHQEEQLLRVLPWTKESCAEVGVDPADAASLASDLPTSSLGVCELRLHGTLSPISSAQERQAHRLHRYNPLEMPPTDCDIIPGALCCCQHVAHLSSFYELSASTLQKVVFLVFVILINVKYFDNVLTTRSQSLFK